MLFKTLAHKWLVLLSAVLVISACGGGGGNPPPTPDTRPTSFSFTALTGAELSTEYTSAEVTITGIEAAAAVSVAGGEYSVNGGDFTSAAGTVTLGQTLSVRATSSSLFSTDSTVTVTVGGVSASFIITTLAEDTTPEVFTFTAETNANMGALYESNAVTIAGINSAAVISIANGEYSIGGGTYTSTAGTITNGQAVAVRQTSSASAATETVK